MRLSFSLSAVASVAVAVEASELAYMQHVATFGRTVASLDDFNARYSAYLETDAELRKINDTHRNFSVGHN